jgi:hypothetical protein
MIRSAKWEEAPSFDLFYGQRYTAAENKYDQTNTL